MERIKFDYKQKIDITKKKANHLLLNLYLYNIFSIVIIIITILVTFYAAFESNDVMSFLKIKNVSADTFSFLMIMLSAFFAAIGAKNAVQLNQICSLKYVAQYEQNIDSNDKRIELIDRDFERVYYLLDKEAQEYINEDKTLLHGNRMKIRDIIIISGVLLSIIVSLIGCLYLNWRLPEVAASSAIIAYLLVLVEFFASLVLRKKQSNINDYVLHYQEGTEEYNDHINDKMSIPCIIKIVKMTSQRLNYRYLIWNIVAQILTYLALIFSFLDFFEIAGDFLNFLDFPSNTQIVTLMFLIISSVIIIAQVLTDKNTVQDICTLNYMIELAYFNTHESDADIRSKFGDLQSKNVISDLDISRGKYEYTCELLQTKRILPQIPDRYGFKDKSRANMARVNGLFVFGTLEVCIFNLWRDIDLTKLVTFELLVIAVYVITILIMKLSLIYRSKKIKIKD